MDFWLSDSDIGDYDYELSLEMKRQKIQRELMKLEQENLDKREDIVIKKDEAPAKTRATAMPKVSQQKERRKPGSVFLKHHSSSPSRTSDFESRPDVSFLLLRHRQSSYMLNIRPRPGSPVDPQNTKVEQKDQVPGRRRRRRLCPRLF